jgi:predicted site-specific integrase-resolvase
MSKSEPKVYLKERAAAKLGVSVTTVLRYARKMGKLRSALGTRTRFVFSEQELADIQALRSRE